MDKKDNSIKTAFFLNLVFTVMELIGGIISGSIAILADSLRDFADTLPWVQGGTSKKRRKKELLINTHTATPASRCWGR